MQGGRDPLTGRRLQLSGSAPTERKAVALERQLRLDAERKATESVTLTELVEEWWAGKPRLAATTRANYRVNLENHILPVLGHREVRDLRPRLLAAFLRDLGERRGLAPATLRKVRTVLSAVMSCAAAMEYVETNPVMRVPPAEVAPSERAAPTIEETAKLLLAAELHDPDFLAFLWVAAEGGGRRGETLALRWRDIDFARRTITISQTITYGDDGIKVRPSTKTGKSRVIGVSGVTLGQLQELKRRVEGRISDAAGEKLRVAPDDLVFSGGEGSRRHLLDGESWGPQSTSRRFARLKRKAGVRPEVDLHGLRHTMVTELLAAGVDPRTVMGRAGHTSETTTMTVYAHVRPAVSVASRPGDPGDRRSGVSHSGVVIAS